MREFDKGLIIGVCSGLTIMLLEKVWEIML